MHVEEGKYSKVIGYISNYISNMKAWPFFEKGAFGQLRDMRKHPIRWRDVEKKKGGAVKSFRQNPLNMNFFLTPYQQIGQPTRALCAPSTGRHTPDMNFASSDARNRAAYPTSQALPIPPFRGTRSFRRLINTSLSSPMAPEMPSTAIGVFIKPGIMTLARMPYWA